MPTFFLNHISGRFGASGVAVFSFMKDLIHLNLVVSVVLCSWLVAPAFYQMRILGQPLDSIDGWTTQHRPAADYRCPHVTTTLDSKVCLRISKQGKTVMICTYTCLQINRFAHVHTQKHTRVKGEVLKAMDDWVSSARQQPHYRLLLSQQ